jgi:chromosome segregation ATPase
MSRIKKLFGGKKKVTWYVRSDDKQVAGPFDEAELIAMAQDGKLASTDKLSNDQKKWTAAARMKWLESVLSESSEPEEEEKGDIVVTEQTADAMEELLQDKPASTHDAPAVKAVEAAPDPSAPDAAPAVKVKPVVKPVIEPDAPDIKKDVPPTAKAVTDNTPKAGAANKAAEKKAAKKGARKSLKGKKPIPAQRVAVPEEPPKAAPVTPDVKAESRPEAHSVITPDRAAESAPKPAAVAKVEPVSEPKPVASPAPLSSPSLEPVKPRAEENKLVELERQVEDLTARLETAEDDAAREKRSLQTRIDILESKLQAIKDRESAVQRDHEHEKSRLKRETEAVMRQLESANEDLEARKQQIFTLRNETRDELQALRENNAQLKAENQNLEAGLREQEEELAALRQQHHTLMRASEAQEEKFNEQLLHLQDNAESSATILEDVWNQLEKQKAQIESMITPEDFALREQELENEITLARQESASQAARLEQQKQQAAQRERTLHDQLQKAGTERDNAAKQIAALEGDLKSAITRAGSLEDELKASEAEVDKLRKQEKVINEKASSLSASLEALEKQLKATEAAHQKTLKDAKENFDKQLKTTEAAHQNAIKDANEKFEKQAKELAETKAALARAEEAGERLAHELFTQIEEIRAELGAAVEDTAPAPSGPLTDADTDRLKSRIQLLRKEAAETSELKAEAEKLRSSLEEATSQSKHFKRNLNQAEEKYMILEQKLVLTEGRESRLIKRLDQVESLMKMLRAQME